MLNPQYATLFSYYNSSSGVIQIASMLPHFLQEKWTTLASSYKKTHQVSFEETSDDLVENVFEILDSHLEYVQICVKDNDLNC
jgi:hypothetical protein